MAEMSDAQKKRAEARKRRRGKAQAEPADDGKAPASESSGQDAESHQAVKQAAKVAAAGAAVGAAAAAARALTSHDDEPGAPEDAAEQEAPAPPGDEASAETEMPPAEADADEGAEPEPEPEPEAENEPEPEREERDPVAGAEATDARQTIDRAREQLEDLLGRPVETVSSLERTHDGWVVALEVVELSRIPESTDVLASYEMELDEGLNLRRYQQVRRYHRGRADRAEDS